MAIGPYEAIILGADRGTELAELEARIDEELKQKYVVNFMAITIPIDILPLDLIGAAIVERYRRAGWAEVRFTEHGLYFCRG